MKKCVSVAVLIGGYQVNNNIINYLFGPRVSVRTGRVTPYFNILFGGVYAAAQTNVTTAPCTGTSCGNPSIVHLTNSQNAFAMAVGGGLDIKVAKHVAFRPIGLDYFLTRLHNPVDSNDHNQNNLRYSAGVNFLFGGQ